MYHFSGQHPGVTVTGVSKSKMTPSTTNKQTIAISGTSKRKLGSQVTEQ